MIKRSPKPYLFLLAALLLLLSLPVAISERIRGLSVATLAPLWTTMSNKATSNVDMNLQKLQIENRLLHAEIARLQDLLQQNRVNNLGFGFLSTQPQAIPAQVIFRSPSSWNSSLWINVGRENNPTSGKEIIGMNSPVVVGNSVVGIVDYVGEQQCRVRLITDSGLSPSVRAARGEPHKQMVTEQLSLLMSRVALYQGLFANQKDRELLLKGLAKIQKKLSHESAQGTWYLAKGELHGSSHPLWRSRGSLLHGVGFNYDFADEKGPARDLKTGIPIDGSSKDAIALLQVNDLLVTTGMDGVFPAGLYVAEITKIHLLKEGDYSYELEARPTAGDLQELSTVFVLPPVRKGEK